MKPKFYLLFILLSCLYSSVLLAQPLVDMGLYNFPLNSNKLEIRLRATQTVTNGAYSGGIFTVRFPSALGGTLSVSSSPYNYSFAAPAGSSGGYEYYRFQFVQGFTVNWTAGQEYVAAILDYSNGPATGAFELITGVPWTNMNNGNFYQELNGLEAEGIFYAPLYASINSTTNVSCNGGSNGAIDINVTGGTPGYTYDWSNNGSQMPDTDPQDLTGLPAGTYTVTVTDASSATTTISATITQPALPVSVTSTQTNILCFGASTGAINITAAGGTGAYTYDWADIAGNNNVEDRSGLAAGTYTVIVSDANSCTASTSVTITQPGAPVSVTSTQTNVLCFGASTGAINITAAGGTGAYTYDWTDIAGSTNVEDRTGLAAGTYTVIVSDANSCTASTSVTITQPGSAVSVTSTQTNVLCFGASTGAINITAAGGTGAYTYDWADIAGSTNVEDRTGLPAGTYTVIVSDANSCTASTSVTITQPGSAVSVTSTQTNVLCFGASTGAINITAAGGTGAYTYDWADIMGSNDVEDRTGLAAGTYTVIVSDANSCTASTSVTITQPGAAVSVTSTQTNVLCFGASTGAINLTAAGGTGAYTYDWADIAGVNDTEDRIGLPAGTYTVIVSDANSCTASTSVTITQPASAVSVTSTQTNVLCFGASTGAINITAAGGTGAYTYDWTDIAGSTNVEDRTGLPAGTYTVIVSDANSCTASTSVTITQPGSAVSVTSTQTNVLCFGASTGAINITAAGGTGAYTYDWADIMGSNDVEDRTGLAAGTYTVIVSDANSCTASTSVTITQPGAAVSVTFTQTNVLCFGGSTGAINITAAGGTGAYTYDWADIAGTTNVEDRTGLAAGTYTVIVSDANSCTASTSVTITQPGSAVSVTSTQTNVLCFGASTGAINITAAGGTGAYTYDWTDIAGVNDTEDRTGIPAGTYTVIVSDANSCTASTSVTITQNAAVVAVISGSLSYCAGNNTTLTASGGVSYAWSNGDMTAATTVTFGTYTVVATDANGCTDSETAIVTENARPTGAISGSTSICVGQSATLTLTVTGTGAISGTLSDGTTFSGTAPTITVSVTPAVTTTYTIATLIDANCSAVAGGLTGSAVVTVSGCADISGKLFWEGDRLGAMSGVNLATVTLSGSSSDTDVTGLAGTYTVTTTMPGTYTVTPVKNRPMPFAINGLTAADASRIQQHVIMSFPLTDTYKLIAADANKSNSITAADASLIQQAVLGNPAAQLQFINNTWRFVQKSYVFPDPLNPWSLGMPPYFPESITLTSGASGQDFIGVKLGDVNNTANPANVVGTDAPNLVWTVQDRLLEANTTFVAEFHAKNYNELLALQFALQFDPAKIQFQGIESIAGSPLQTGNFGMYNVANGEIRAFLAMTQSLSLPDGLPVFRIRFNALQGGFKLSDVLQLDNNVLLGEAYLSDYTPGPVKLQFESIATGTVDVNETADWRLLQNIPNPFKNTTTIGFILPGDCDARMRIFDASGRLIAEQKAWYPKGYNAMKFQMNGYTGEGVLYYELTTTFGTLSKKMVLVRE